MVKITKGTYGHKVGRIVKPVYAGETVELTPEQEERLIRIGVAVKVTETQAEENTEKNGELPTYDKNMKLPELIAIAEAYGVDASKARTKAEVIEAIEAAQGLPDLGGDDTVVD